MLDVIVVHAFHFHRAWLQRGLVQMSFDTYKKEAGVQILCSQNLPIFVVSFLFNMQSWSGTVIWNLAFIFWDWISST